MNDLSVACSLTSSASLLDVLPHVEWPDLLLQQRLHWNEQHTEDCFALQTMILSSDAVDARLACPTGRPTWLDEVTEVPPPAPCPTGRLAQLVTRFGLSEIERDLLVLSLLPHLDSRYAVLSAYAQQSERRIRPTLDWALRLLCPDGMTRLVQQARLGPHAPLFAYRLVRRPVTDEAQAWVELEISDSVYCYLIGGEAPLPVPCTDWLFAVAGAFGPVFAAQLARSWESLARPILLVRGEAGSGRGAALAAAAASAGRRAMRLDLAALPEEEDEASTTLERVLRDTRLWDISLVLESLDVLAETRPRLFASFARQITMHPIPVAVLMTPHTPLMRFATRTHVLHKMPASPAQDNLTWLREQLAPYSGAQKIDQLELHTLARRFRLTPAVVAQTLPEADLYRQQRDPHAALEMSDLTRAFGLRAQRHFGKLAQRVTPSRSWEDLVLADGVQQQLREIEAAIRHRESVLARGFARKLGNSTGISALFYGDSGSGKTLAAEVRKLFEYAANDTKNLYLCKFHFKKEDDVEFLQRVTSNFESRLIKKKSGALGEVTIGESIGNQKNIAIMVHNAGPALREPTAEGFSWNYKDNVSTEWGNVCSGDLLGQHIVDFHNKNYGKDDGKIKVTQTNMPFFSKRKASKLLSVKKLAQRDHEKVADIVEGLAAENVNPGVISIDYAGKSDVSSTIRYRKMIHKLNALLKRHVGL